MLIIMVTGNKLLPNWRVGGVRIKYFNLTDIILQEKISANCNLNLVVIIPSPLVPQIDCSSIRAPFASVDCG